MIKGALLVVAMVGGLSACDSDSQAEFMFGEAAGKADLIQRSDENGAVALATDSQLARLVASNCNAVELDSAFYNMVKPVLRRIIFVSEEKRRQQSKERGEAFLARHGIDSDNPGNLCAVAEREIGEHTVLSGFLNRI